MRKVFILSAASLILIAGCRKTKEEQAMQNMQMLTDSIPVPPGFTYYEFGEDILEEDFLSNLEDAAYEAFNYVNYALTLSLLELYKNHPAIFSSLVSATNSTPNKCYNMFKFATEIPAINPVFDSVFASRFTDFVVGSTWQGYIDAHYVYDTSYIPFTKFVNNCEIDFGKNPYVAAPFEISEEKFPEFDDNIPLWINTPNGTLFTTIDENSSFDIDNAVILITNGFDDDDIDEYIKSVSNRPGAKNPLIGVDMCENSTHFHENLSHRKFKINHRFESTGKSEYAFVYATTTGYDIAIGDWRNKYAGGKDFREIKKVDKNDVGTLINWDFKVYHPALYPNGSSSVPALCFEIASMYPNVYQTYAVGAFERDWFSMARRVYYVKDHNGNLLKYKDYRAFFNDWYFFHPDTNDEYPFDLRNPTQYSTYYNYTRGELQLQRWH